MRNLTRGTLAAILFSAIWSAGCAANRTLETVNSVRDDAVAEAKALKLAGASDAAIFTVMPDGKIYPKTGVVRGSQAVVWWSADGTDLSLISNTGGAKIDCKKKGVCSMKHFGVTGPSYVDYAGTINGNVTVDPRIEIVY